MIVAAVQHDIQWEQPAATYEHVRLLVAQAATAGARLVALTEMFATGFSPATDRIAEPPDGPSAQFLVALAGEHDVWVCGSIAERSRVGELPANTLVIAAPDGATHRYAKVHPFSYAGEHERFRAGDAPLTVAVDDVRCSFSVCYDLRFTESYWPLASTTDCYVVVANWPASRREHWRTLLRARAIENQAYVVGVNRVGSGGGLEYVGDSAVVDPLGEVIIEAADEERVLVADVDPEVVRATRERYPFLADRRNPGEGNGPAPEAEGFPRRRTTRTAAERTPRRARPES